MAVMMAYILFAIIFQSIFLYLSRFAKKGKEIPEIFVKILEKWSKKEKEISFNSGLEDENKWKRNVRKCMWMKIITRLDQAGLILFIILITLTPLIVFLVIPSII